MGTTAFGRDLTFTAAGNSARRVTAARDTGWLLYTGNPGAPCDPLLGGGCRVICTGSVTVSWRLGRGGGGGGDGCWVLGGRGALGGGGGEGEGTTICVQAPSVFA